MTAEYEITKDDLSAFNLYHHRHSPTARQQYLRSWLVPAFIGLLVFSGIWFLANRERGTPLRTFLDLLPLLSFVPLYLLYFPWAYRRKLRKIVDGMVGEGQNRGLFGRHCVTISPEGITDSGELGQTSTAWRAVERVAAADEHAYIYTNALAAVIVPRRAFAGPAEFGEFVRTARGHHEKAVVGVIPALPVKAALLILICTALAACASEPTSKSLRQCPNGHSTLKDVPIVYGLLAFKGPEAEKWNRGFANLEFASGGCVSSPNAPKIQVTCTKCRFNHRQLLTDDPNTGYWTRSSTDPKSFTRPFSSFISGFPTPPPKRRRGPTDYTQEYSDSGAPQMQSLDYTSTEPAAELQTRIDRFLREQGLTARFYSRSHTSTFDGTKRDILEWEGDRFSVRMDREHSDSSWVAAYFHPPQ